MTFLNLSSGLMCTLVKRTGIYNVCKVYGRNTVVIIIICYIVLPIYAIYFLLKI